MSNKNFKFEDGTKAYLVFEGGFHHGLYFDLRCCIFHYNWLLKYRKDDSSFIVFEMLYDSDMSSFTPNGVVCTIYKDLKIVCRYKSDYEIIKTFSDNFKVSLDEYKPLNFYSYD